MKARKLSLDIGKDFKPPTEGGTTHISNGAFNFYHYNCDGFHDQGWGCGYRTLQSLCSWIENNTGKSPKLCSVIPSITKVQEVLVELEDKPPSFVSSKEWIGSFEACLIIDQLYDVPCKILHINKGINIKDHLENLIAHFIKFKSPAMMGGDQDCSSKGIAGVHVDGEKAFLLVFDPHFTGQAASMEKLQSAGWIEWHPLERFSDDSFYNICLPQVMFVERPTVS